LAKQLSEMTLEELWELFPIILKKHNPVYKEWYELERERLINLSFNKDIKRINHIGSSAVKGLIAKPTIDILLELDRNCNIDHVIDELKKDNWLLMQLAKEPDMKLTFNKGYTPDGFAEKVFHLHVRHYGDWNELYFRDYLLAHEDVAEKYGKLKLSLLEEYEHDRDGYTDAKSKFIMRITEQAKKEYGSRYIP